ncbi:MAG: pre-peptidase C-terminal domain-containing protein, partial [Deltaproteobacteria bacterium]|nr:pre-peptidase C-terminal domain-containing protein [Deltaproteobacteria bacterium]
VSHDYTACAGDDIYWFDSCDVQEDIETDCAACETCVLILGNPACQAADLQDHLECNSDDVWWFDSCSNPTSLFDDCTTNEQCVGTADPPECQCLPGWVGIDCDTWVCDSVTESNEDCPNASTIGRDDLPAALMGESTTPYADDYNFNCDSWDQPGRDRAYRVYLFAGENVDVLMDPDTDLSLFVFHPSDTSINLCDATTEIDCSDNNNLADETINFTAPEDGWYYIVADSWQAGIHGTYDLYINITNPVEGQCYGGGVIVPCTNQFTYFDWSDGAISPPMVAATSTVITDMVYIFTTVQDNGMAGHTFDIPCDDTWYMWGLRWKPDNDLATFRFQVDGNPVAPIVWDLSGGPDNTWDWDQANGSLTAVWSSFLTTGTHALTVLGGESDGSSTWEHPALGFVIFTNDPAFVPPDPNTL